MARYIREVRDFNGTVLSLEESVERFPKIAQGEDWYQPGFERLVVRHVREMYSVGEEGSTHRTIATVGPPFVIPHSIRIRPGSSRPAGFRGAAQNYN
jgi:hypothetical protein